MNQDTIDFTSEVGGRFYVNSIVFLQGLINNLVAFDGLFLLEPFKNRIALNFKVVCNFDTLSFDIGEIDVLRNHQPKFV